MKHYQITCPECKATRKIGIVQTAVGDRIDWLENDPDEAGIISGRQRLDGNFGWQCLCGNNDLLTAQENKQITNKVEPDPKEIQDVIKNLVPQQPKFIMEAV